MRNKIAVVENILSANDQISIKNRTRLDAAGVLGINLMASPGAGKTSLIEHTIRSLASKYRIAMINGDIATSIDADRGAAAGAIAVQINTGGACHLDAIMLYNGLDQIDLNQFDLLLVENVGNLICPASFKLGTHKNILIASIPEGDDKPYKYPTIYRGVDTLVINKIDLLPYIPFNLDHFQKGVEILNPGLFTIPLSCYTGEGVDKWIAWVSTQIQVNKE